MESLYRLLLDYKPADRRAKDDRVDRLPRLVQFSKIFCGYIPGQESLTGGGDERVGALSSVRDRRLLHLVAGPQRQQILVLGVEQIGAVQRKERLTSLYGLARVIHIEVTNPS